MKFRAKPFARFATAAGMLLLLVLWVAGELTRPASIPQPPDANQILSASGDTLLRNACFDCHSSETAWPWYARLPVVSLVLNYHVSEGREELNFSEWPLRSGKYRYESLKESREAVAEGEMPPKGYTLLHSQARIGPGERALLNEEFSNALAALTSSGGSRDTGRASGHYGRYEDDDDDDDDDDDGDDDDDNNEWGCEFDRPLKEDSEAGEPSPVKTVHVQACAETE